MNYVGDVGSLKLTLYGPGAWELVEEQRGMGARPEFARFETKDVTVGGQPAVLRTYFGTINPIASQMIIVERGATIIEAQTRAVISATPMVGHANPLMNEGLLLAVMENLRLYPE